MKRFTTDCIVLKNINYKDSDKIFTLYTNKKGKLTATAKGVRKISSRRGRSLDSLNYLQVHLSEGSNGFYYINEVSHLSSFSKIKDDYSKSVKGYYVIELLHRLVEDGEPNDRIFLLLLKTLKLLESNVLHADVIIGFYELMLMKELGYALNFNSCVSCRKPFNSTWPGYRLNFGLGGLTCNDCRSGLLITKEDALFLNTLEKGKVPKEGNISKETLDLIKTFIQDILDDRFRTSRIFGVI